MRRLLLIAFLLIGTIASVSARNELSPAVPGVQSTRVPARAAQSSPVRRASFDCGSPSTALQTVICGDSQLRQADVRVDQAYQQAKISMSAEQQGSLTDSEHKWLRFVSRTCLLGPVAGIPSVTARSCIRATFQARIAQLKKCPHTDPQKRIPCLNDFHVSEEQRNGQQ